MTDVRRYEPLSLCNKVDCIEVGDGDYVLYADYTALKTHIAELEAKLAKAVDALNTTKGNLHEIEALDMSTFEAQDVIDATLTELKGTD